MKKNLLKSTFVVSFMTATSRVTGFMRDLVFAHFFGAAAGMDAFIVAYRIPNFLRRLFAEGAFSQAFVPVLSEYKEKRTHEEVQVFLNRIAGVMTTFLFCVTLLAVLITPWLVYVFTPGFGHDPTRYSLTVSMLRITFPYILFISLTAYVSGILNSYGKFSIPAFTPNLLNFALIGAAIFMAPHFKDPVKALAWGIFIGGAAQLLFQLPFLKKLNLMPRPEILWKDPGVRRVLRLMLPAIFGVSVAQISLLVDTVFASFLRQGSMSWLYFSDRLTSFPLGVFGVAVATVVLPYLARKHASESHSQFSRGLDWALRFILLIGIPATIGIIFLAGPILITLLQYGKFVAFDVTMAQKSLIGFAIGIPPVMLVKVLASGFYAKQNIKTPVKIAIAAVICNVVLNAILIFPMAHAGLAYSTSIASVLNAGLLFFFLLKKKIYVPAKDWRRFAWQFLLASAAMGILLWFANYRMDIWLSWSWLERAWHLGMLLSAAIFLYFAVLWASGVRIKHFLLPND